MVIGNNKSKKNPFPLQVAFGQYLISATESKLKQIGIVNMGIAVIDLAVLLGGRLMVFSVGAWKIMLREIQVMKIWLVKFQRRV